MKYVKPGRTKGALQIIGSKSVMQRAVACALLCEGETVLNNPSLCDDGLASLDIVEALGAKVQKSKDKISILSNGVKNKINSREISVNESGLSIRLFTSIVSLFDGEFILKGEGSLKSRSMKSLCETLNKIGVEISSENNNPPIKIKGPIKSGEYAYDGSSGSQVLSGLLTALPLCSGDSTIQCLNLTSKPYIDLTVDVLKTFKVNVEWNKNSDIIFVPGNQAYHTSNLKIEGDWSGASFFAVLGALSGEVSLEGLNSKSYQGDREIISVIENVGAAVSYSSDKILITPNLKTPFIFDATDTPDLFPPLVVLASFITGTSKIKGAHRLKGKESDRAEVLISEFSKIGAKIDLIDDEIIIHGEGKISGGDANSHNDHRIAMALAVAGVLSENGVTISNHQCVSKSYPNFFEELESLRIL